MTKIDDGQDNTDQEGGKGLGDAIQVNILQQTDVQRCVCKEIR